MGAPGAQAVALADEGRRVEGLGSEVDAAGRLPAEVDLQAVGCFAIRQPLEGLQHHHGGDQARRDRRSPPHRVRVEVGEVVVGEEAISLVGQQPVDRALAETIAEDLARVLEAVLHQRHA